MNNAIWHMLWQQSGKMEDKSVIMAIVIYRDF